MNKTNLILILAITVGTNAFAASAKEKSIRELFSLQKTERIAEQVMGQVVENLSPQVPQDKQKKLAEVAKKEARANDLIDSLVPIYDKNLSEQEINEVIAFYKTPTGQKYISIQPKLIGESTALIQSWATKYADRVKDKMGIKK